MLLAPLVAALPLGACGDAGDAPRVRIATNLTVPRALLDRVAALGVTVYEGASCDDATGVATKDGATKIAERPLASTGCIAPAKFCGDLQIEKSDAPRVFEAIGTDASGATLATGCATATVNQDALPVSIRMFRFLAPAVCGDGVVQPTEQCEPGGTATCDETCQSSEILLSTGSTQNGTSTGQVGDKTDPFFLWPTGAAQAGWFYAFYTDHVPGAKNVDVGMRVMNDDLTPTTTPPAPVAFGLGSLYLPNGSNGNTLPPSPATGVQALPSAAVLGGAIWVAFEDDNPIGAPTNGIDVHVRSMSPSGVADQGTAPLGVNGANGDGEANIQGAPAIAASGGKLFVAWEDQGAGKIAGRAITPGSPPALGGQNDLSTGTGNSHVSVARAASGWVAVWQSGTGIRLRAIGSDGTPSGAEQPVNDGGAAASSPRVASLEDGRFAVVWTAGDDVFVQRYDAKGAKIPGDQTAPVTDVVTEGKQSAPAIGATTAAGGSYVVAWADEASGHVRARMLGGLAGFLFNNVDGQSSEFQASRADGRTRVTPVVASGGSGPFVAIGWEDQTAGGAGVVARRFPLPSE
jgi:hypothetical protein